MTGYRNPAFWPSIQQASSMLAQRMAAQLRLIALRKQLAEQFERYDRKAA